MLGAIIVGLIGCVFLIVGYLIRKKEKISLLHDYHHDQVSEADKKAFCALSGWGITTIGIGCLITAILIGITDSAWSFIAFGVSFAIGLSLLICAEKRYN